MKNFKTFLGLMLLMLITFTMAPAAVDGASPGKATIMVSALETHQAPVIMVMDGMQVLEALERPQEHFITPYTQRANYDLIEPVKDKRQLCEVIKPNSIKRFIQINWGGFDSINKYSIHGNRSQEIAIPFNKYFRVYNFSCINKLLWSKAPINMVCLN